MLETANFIRDEVFPFINLTKNIQYNFLEDAKLSIIEPVILSQIIELLMVRFKSIRCRYKRLFGYILKQIKSWRIGQYRTQDI